MVHIFFGDVVRPGGGRDCSGDGRHRPGSGIGRNGSTFAGCFRLVEGNDRRGRNECEGRIRAGVAQKRTADTVFQLYGLQAAGIRVGGERGCRPDDSPGAGAQFAGRGGDYRHADTETAEGGARADTGGFRAGNQAD
nr:hypothetical protein [Odoribacter lunatus]